MEKISVGFPFIGKEEIKAVVKNLEEKNLASGKVVGEFEKNFAKYMGTKYAVALNSGSSANLLSLQTLLEAGGLKKGDRVILPATTFITVATPIVQLGLKPIFVDVDPSSYNLDPVEVEKISKQAECIFIVHSLGNPASIEEIIKVARRNKLVVIEDCCESHGASISGKKVGSFGSLATFSFHVAHNMTTGEGGMVVTNDEKFYKILKSLREFGRVEAKERYGHFEKLGIYDNRYVFERLGYNLRMTELQAAIGNEQLKKLDKMNQKRREMAAFYTKLLSAYPDFFQLPTENGYHTYYAYLLVVKKTAPFSRENLVEYLEENGIETRPFFAGFIPDQPAFEKVDYQLAGDLKNSLNLKDNSFFIGTHPAIGAKEREKVRSVFLNFLDRFKKQGKISCIVVSYNKPGFLKEAVGSVLAQTYQNFEIILIDGGSSDREVKKLLKLYSKNPKIKLLYTGETPEDRKTKAMLSVSINQALEATTGEFVSYLCDDDKYYPERFAEMITAFRANPQAQVIYSWQNVYGFAQTGKKKFLYQRRVFGLRGEKAKTRLKVDCILDMTSLMHKKESLNLLKKPYWPEEIETRHHNDGVFMERLGQKAIFYPLYKVLDEHRFTPKSINKSRARFLEPVLMQIKSLIKRDKRFLSMREGQ